MSRALTVEESAAVREAIRLRTLGDATPEQVIIAKLAEQIEWMGRRAAMAAGREP